MAVELITSHGTLRVTLFCKDAPKTCRNFIELCKNGYYDGVIFHRVVADFVAQTGDPLGDGSGGESIYGPYFEDEIVARLSHNRKGILAMANAGRNTNSSQFFFTLRAAPHLDGKHTVFGQVTDDTLAVLDDISRVPTKDKVPTKPVKIFSATVTEDPWRGQPLPAGASIPEKPLVGTQSKCAVQ